MFLRAGGTLLSFFRERLCRALCAAMLVALCCAVSNAQGGIEDTGTGGRHTIQGRIVFPSGRRADVRLKVILHSSQSGELSVFADMNGSFAFHSLEAGYYTVVIEGGDDFENVNESVYIEPDINRMIPGITTASVSRPYTLQVYLQPKRNVGDPAKVGVVDAALAGVPKPAQDLYQKALDAERKNDNDKATSLLSEAIAQYPQFGLAHGELGMIQLKTGQLDKAVGELKEAQKSLPDNPQIQLDYGIALAQKRDYAGAETQLRAALSKIRNAGSGHMYLGITLIGLKRNDEAEGELLEAVKLGSEQLGLAHKFLGGIYWGKGDSKRAADELELYVKLTPKAADAERIRQTIKDLRAKK